MDARRKASQLRRQMHEACANRNLTVLREALHELYESEASPLGDRGTVGTPAPFAAMVEVAFLARVHACRSNDPVRTYLADELEQNVDRLRKGFGIDHNTTAAVHRCFTVCDDTEYECLTDVQKMVTETLVGTQLEGLVVLGRHTVSIAGLQ